MKKDEDYNRCRECGSVPIRNLLTCMNKCPNCGRVWSDEWAENMLPPFWERPVKVQFD